MRHHRVVLAGMLLAAMLPLSAGAMSTSELLAQISSLLGQITQLQAQIALLDATSSSSSAPVVTSAPSVVPAALSRASCPALSRALSRGSRGDDVRSLQSFLLSHEYLGQDGVTGYFGPLTESAVKLWQKNNDIASSGTAATTGWGLVGARTRSAIFASCDASIPQNDTLSIGAQGLTVTVGVTVNAQSSCKAGSYTLDYGDGTTPQVISVPANTCRSLQQTFSHVYASAGAYTVVLSRSGTRIHAPITLAAPPVCNAPVFATDDVPSGTVGVLWTLPLFVSLSSTSDIAVMATGTPPGIGLSATTTAVSSTTAAFSAWNLAGIPTNAGMYTLTLSGTNSCGSITRTLVVPVSSTSIPL